MVEKKKEKRISHTEAVKYCMTFLQAMQQTETRELFLRMIIADAKTLCRILKKTMNLPGTLDFTGKRFMQGLEAHIPDAVLQMGLDLTGSTPAKPTMNPPAGEDNGNVTE